jgi:5-methylcytosine-specific restriction endonuclease McrA
MCYKNIMVEITVSDKALCAYCGFSYPKDNVVHDLRFGMEGLGWDFCPTCLEIVEKKYCYRCEGCGGEFVQVNHQELSHPYICPTCRTKYPEKEINRLYRALNKAKRLNLPATLTMGQWVRILDFFGHKCVYCMGEYTDIEHLIPLSKGGGTTKDNCYPSCSQCNSSKSNKRMFPINRQLKLHEQLIVLAEQGQI